MELEQRVKMLEQEVEVLKHQLQTTLLDIQELLLTNAYPSLRSEESASGAARTANHRVAQPADEPAEQPAPVIKRVSLEVENDGEEETRYPEVVEPVRKVASKKAVKTPLPIDDELVDEDDDVLVQPSRNGRKPPAEDDQDYVQPRKVAAKKSIRAPLLASDEPPVEQGEKVPARPSRSGRKPHIMAEADEQDYEPPVVRKVLVETPRSQAEAMPDLDEWVHNKIEQVGVRRTLELIQLYGEEQRITPEMREELLHIVGTSRRNGTSIVPTAASTEQAAPESNDDESQKLILKLIAGVQNAGAGIGRRKKRG